MQTIESRKRKTATETTIPKKYPAKMDQYSYNDSNSNDSRKHIWNQIKNIMSIKISMNYLSSKKMSFLKEIL